MPDRRGVRLGFLGKGFVEPVLENGGDRAVAGGADGVAAFGRCFQTRDAVAEIGAKTADPRPRKAARAARGRKR